MVGHASPQSAWRRLRSALRVRVGLPVVVLLMFLSLTISLLLATMVPAANTRSITGSQIDSHWVAVTGADQGSGTAQQPWRTIQYAVDHVPAGAHLYVGVGTFGPFVSKTARLTIVGSGANLTVVRGDSTRRDVVGILGPETLLTGLAIIGCVPRDVAGGGYEQSGSSGLSLSGGASGSVIDDVSVSGAEAVNSYGLNFGCFGIAARDVTDVVIRNSNISHNGFGVFVFGGGGATVIADNIIHDNTSMIRNTPLQGDDFGGVAIGFANVSASSGTVASGNDIHGNQAVSHDFGTDGGAFEIFNSSYISMIHNRISNNENALETGSGAGGRCQGNAFSNNTVIGRSVMAPVARSVGLLLRCARSMNVTDNTFALLDWWVFDLEPSSQGSTLGLRITGNDVTQAANLVFELHRGATGEAYRIHDNQYGYTGTFAVDWTGNKLADEAEVVRLLSRPATDATGMATGR